MKVTNTAVRISLAVANYTKEVGMIHHQLLFRTFLWLYGSLILYHVWRLGIDSWEPLAGMLICMAIAFLAHRKHGYIPSALLVAHMGMEWYHHALHGSHYTNWELVFYGVHALFDAVFLCVEAKEHYGRWARHFVLAIIALLVGIFAYCFVPAVPAMPSFASPFAPGVGGGHADHSHSHGGELLHYALLGGMLGCLGFQLLARKHHHQH
jgi:hypothetical protein